MSISHIPLIVNMVQYKMTTTIVMKRCQERRAKTRNAIDRLSIIWKYDFFLNKIIQDFFQAEAVSILLYGCTTWTRRKRIEKKLDENCTRMLHAVFNKSWKQHITKTTVVRPPTSHLTKHLIKMNKAWRVLLEKWVFLRLPTKPEYGTRLFYNGDRAQIETHEWTFQRMFGHIGIPLLGRLSVEP